MIKSQQQSAESFRLLSISSESSENNGGTMKSEEPDLKLEMPVNSSVASSVAGKIRRKIRLKRKQRDRLSNGLHSNLAASTTSETGGSELEDCSQLASKRLRRCLSLRRTHHNKQHCLQALVLFIFALALASLAYYTMTLQNQIAVMAVHIDPVLDDKSTLEKSSAELQNHLSYVIGNQSKLQDNLTAIATDLASLTRQLNALNASVSSVLTSLVNAPQLKTVPDDIVEIKKDLAQFGSRLTDMENQVTGTANDLQLVKGKVSSITNPGAVQVTNAVVEELNAKVNARIKNETSRLDSKIDSASANFKVLATNLTEELQKQELHASKSWKLLEQLNTDIQNVSAKALSNELVSQVNKNDIAQLKLEQARLHSTNSNDSSATTVATKA